MQQKQPHFPLVALSSRAKQHFIPAGETMTGNQRAWAKQTNAKTQQSSGQRATTTTAQGRAMNVPLPFFSVDSGRIGK
jgi:hypothetical protein